MGKLSNHEHLKFAIELRHRHVEGRLLTNTDIFLLDLLGQVLHFLNDPLLLVT